jgi:transposase-like protein
MRESVKERKATKRYDEEFKRQAVELVIHSGKTQAQIARELGVSDYSLTLWKKDYLRHAKSAQLDGEQMSPEQMFEKIRQLQEENEYLKRQREIFNIDRNWELTPFLSGAKIRQPSLFVAGEFDAVVTMYRQAFDSLEETMPGLTKKVLVPGAGHWIQQERPNEVNELLIEFLASL